MVRVSRLPIIFVWAVCYTLPWLNISIVSGLGNIKSRQRVSDHITCMELKYLYNKAQLGLFFMKVDD